MRAASLIVVAASVMAGLALLVGVAVRHDRSITDGFWLYRPLLYVHLVSTTLPAAARLARILAVAVAGAIAVITFRRTPGWLLAKVPGSIRVGVGIVAGGLVSNMAELVWLGGATDFIGVPYDGVYSLGDLGLHIGATMMVGGWWAHPTLWPEWLVHYRIGWLWLVIVPGVIYLGAQGHWGVLGWAIVLALGWLLGTAIRNRRTG